MRASTLTYGLSAIGGAILMIAYNVTTGQTQLFLEALALIG